MLSSALVRHKGSFRSWNVGIWIKDYDTEVCECICVKKKTTSRFCSLQLYATPDFAVRGQTRAFLIKKILISFFIIDSFDPSKASHIAVEQQINHFA